MRFYGFSVEEIAAGGEDGMLDLDIDPKLAWALKHRDRFPVDVNTRRARDAAARAGPRRQAPSTASSRRAGTRRLRLDDVARLHREPQARAAVPGRRRPSPGGLTRPARPAQPARRSRPSS